jgi:hypothetical protein
MSSVCWLRPGAPCQAFTAAAVVGCSLIFVTLYACRVFYTRAWQQHFCAVPVNMRSNAPRTNASRFQWHPREGGVFTTSWYGCGKRALNLTFLRTGFCTVFARMRGVSCTLCAWRCGARVHTFVCLTYRWRTGIRATGCRGTSVCAPVEEVRVCVCIVHSARYSLHHLLCNSSIFCAIQLQTLCLLSGMQLV